MSNMPDEQQIHRLAAGAGVFLLHVFVVWFIAVNVRSWRAPIGLDRELAVTVFAPRLTIRAPLPSPPSETFRLPEDVFVPEPQIEIQTGIPAPAGVPGNPIARRLMPRADPDHVNDRPQLPHALGAWVLSASLELRLLVRADGTIADVEVQRSTGMTEIDRFAVSYVKGTWRYLPASINGRPIEAWTTAIVRFAAM